MSRLVSVRCTFDYVVVVDDAATAVDTFSVAWRNAREAFGDLLIDQCDFDITPYNDARKPYQWDDECIPYGGDGRKTTGEYLK